jgi:hypothetical protein
VALQILLVALFGRISELMYSIQHIHAIFLRSSHVEAA